MAKKSFVMQESDREKLIPMSKKDLEKFMKGDGYDDMRKKIWHEGITETKYEEALPGLEQTISKLKDEKVKTVPITTFKPWEDRICIFPDAEEVMLKSGLYKPSTMQQEKPNRGTVVAVGPGKDGVKIPAVVGMRIYYGKYAGTGIPASPEDPREILIVRYADCFGEI